MPVKLALRYIREDGSVDNDISLTWDDPHEAMRAGNAALPDDDPRKITREFVEYMRMCAVTLDQERRGYPGEDEEIAKVNGFADALAALLPPEDA